MATQSIYVVPSQYHIVILVEVSVPFLMMLQPRYCADLDISFSSARMTIGLKLKGCGNVIEISPSLASFSSRPHSIKPLLGNVRYPSVYACPKASHRLTTPPYPQNLILEEFIYPLPLIYPMKYPAPTSSYSTTLNAQKGVALNFSPDTVKVVGLLPDGVVFPQWIRMLPGNVRYPSES